MFENMNEQQAREEILKQVAAYCDKYHNTKKEFKEGDRIPYASRVYDSEEMVNLVDSSLEFWLTAGRSRSFPPAKIIRINQYHSSIKILLFIPASTYKII